ncbi:23S rRNA (adenine(2503)-C(2))-methyltransferase RlmN [Ferruginivarius sediminum]|uniref:Dual-specificity RNA methyltransferase RlmN n=1 Tax=Ferruginivarius sediminum TaxID=2661937 RepID=A0A369T6Z8_9PROT|nr:23S rRNA (adenine(2503)-C(2))-methyltransferase RlmN [Ferruginivarius sediminum]RDD60234.1 23S rRNA (adenine(2503)-C(2))-methyltransferase RlmN [Ferruginivarius sediminum]
MTQQAHSHAFAPPDSKGGRHRLVGLDRGEMAALVQDLGEPKFRAKQLWHWIYQHGAEDFAEMSSLAKAFRARLGESCTAARLVVKTEQHSHDGTRKWLLRLRDLQEVEAVYIPEEDRGTLCVSSQVGCTLTCRFCHTGTQRLVRNLSAGEILGQIMLARDSLGEWPSPKEGRLLTNIVMMGMGEPLYNYDEVAKALRIAMDAEGLGFSRRRITLSTSGVVPMMQRCGEELGVNLAVSLHAVTDEVRDHLVPLNKKYPIAELLKACRAYPGINNARRITFEYVMLKGVNDSPADARELARLLRDIPAKVNLIPFNPWPGSEFECSTPEAIQRFSDLLYEAGYSAPVRTPRGQDILAACGQLRSESQRQKKAARDAAAQPAAE